MSKPAWIEIIPEDEADGLLRELYDQEMDKRHNVVDNILKVHSLNPKALRAHANLYHTIMHGRSGVRRADREMIAVVVSALNQCHY